MAGPSEGEIRAQWERLAAHRGTLATLLTQRAMVGRAHEAPAVAAAIREAREGVARCKGALRGWGVAVADHPDDAEGGALPGAPPAARLRRWSPALLGLALLVAAAAVSLVARPAAPPEPANLAGRLDFGDPAAGWDQIRRCAADYRRCEPAPGAARRADDGYGAVYDLRLTAGERVNYIIQLPDPVRADLVTAQVWLPDSPDIDTHWVGLAAVTSVDSPWLAGSADAVPLGAWHRLALDLRSAYDAAGRPLSDAPVFLQLTVAVSARAALRSEVVSVRLGELAWYGGAGAPKVREQVGAGQARYGFEDERAAPWRPLPGWEATNRLSVASDVRYRGGYALRVDTELAAGGAVGGAVLDWAGPAPGGVWVARVYLPPGGNETAWAGFYSNGRSGPEVKAKVRLRPGAWTTIAWDAHEEAWPTSPALVGVQVGVGEGAYAGPIFIDDVEIAER